MVKNRQDYREFRLIRISRSIKYALEGMCGLARHYGSGYLRVEQVAKRCGMPAEFLSKIFSRLAARSFVESRRGPGGGFALNRKPGDIRISEILTALAIPDFDANKCLLGHGVCGNGNTCPIHATVVAMEKALKVKLGSITLEQLAGL